MQFTAMRRADIPNNFDDAIKDLIVIAMEAGGEARLSAKGHIIIRNGTGETMAVSRNAGSARGRGWLNTRADVRRLFPGALVPGEASAPAEPARDKMCNRCKDRYPVEDFAGGLYCPGCVELFEAEREAVEEEPELALALPAEAPAEPVKECASCHRVKPHSAFYRNSRATDGRQSYCVDCSREYQQRRKVSRGEAAPAPRSPHTTPVVTPALREALGWSEGRPPHAEEVRVVQEAAQVVEQAGLETVQAAVAFEAIKKLVAGDLVAENERLEAEVSRLEAENARLVETLTLIRRAAAETVVSGDKALGRA